MATVRRQKTALKAVALAFLGGGHYVTECVENALQFQDPSRDERTTEDLRTVLRADYERFTSSPESEKLLIQMLNEEDLYPFGSNWPLEAMSEVIAKIIPPRVTFEKASAPEDRVEIPRFRFKGGFNSTLETQSKAVSSRKRPPRNGDHWMALLLNVVFYAGISTAAQMAENSKTYFSALPEIETEIEPWSKYPQILDTFERQLRREAKRKTGYVSTEDWDS